MFEAIGLIVVSLAMFWVAGIFLAYLWVWLLGGIEMPLVLACILLVPPGFILWVWWVWIGSNIEIGYH